MTAREAAVSAVEAVLADHPDVTARRLEGDRWGLVLEGEVRHAIPVLLEVGSADVTLSSFLLRGPRDPSGAAALHRVLLRKNRGTRWVRLCLDGDDDVLIVARLPALGLDAAQLEAVLGEVWTVAEEGFEGLVHLAYPGVFPPLRRQAPTPRRD